ncbi:hypothetical protein ACRFB9_28360 [Klebsiella pneumoniae]
MRGGGLNNCELGCKYCEGGGGNCNVMIKEIGVGGIGVKIGKIKYNSGICFGFVEYNDVCRIFSFFLYITFNNIIIIILIKKKN